jgi:hypothetical protein
VTKYEDGSVVVNYESPPGKARCEVLGIETGTQFGCNSFEEGHDHIEIMATKTGSPWHHSHYEDCPDCKGRGIPQESEGSCARCCGTGHVLFYDDGYVGEERTRRHPNEGEIGPPPKPTCPGCSRDIETSWKACPFCGVKLDQPADPIRTSEFPL